jgi:hypothetical protein
MRIAHLNWIPNSNAWPSLTAKLRQQARAARDLGLDLDVIVLTNGTEMRDDLVQYRLIRGGPTRVVDIKLRRYASIERSLDIGTYDAVILRYPGASDLSFAGFLDRHGAKLISEHHTKEEHELRVLARGPVAFAKWQLERRNGPRYLAGVRALVAVTGEIRDYELARFPVSRHAVIGNGVDVSAIPMTGFVPFNGRELTLLFCAARFWPWQGLDRLLRGLIAYSGVIRITVHLAGEVSRADRGLLDALARKSSVSVIEHGVVGFDALERLYAHANVAVSTLALGRKGMSTACPLKTRDYCARGLPFIYAYDDPDLDPSPGWLRFADNDAPIDIEAVLEFSRRLMSDAPSLITEMRSYALRRLDWRAKISALHDFTVSVF